MYENVRKGRRLGRTVTKRTEKEQWFPWHVGFKHPALLG